MPAPNFNQHLGIRFVRQHRDGITIECRLRKEFMNFAGVLHGGVTATLADVAVGQALCAASRPMRRQDTSDLHICYRVHRRAGRPARRA